MKKKAFRTASGLALATVLVQSVQPVLAAEEVTYDKTVNVKSEKLDNLVKEAKENGFTVNSTKESRVAKSQEEFDKIQEEAKSELDGLATKYEKYVTAIKDYKEKVKKAVETVKSEEDEIKAKFPLLMEKDGVRVYGRFDETKRGSQEYYKDIHVFTDDESTTTLKDGLGTHSDSTFEVLSGDTQATVTGSAVYHDLSNDKTTPTGSKVKITHVGDTIDGKRVDMIAEVTHFDFQGNDISLLNQVNDILHKEHQGNGYVTLVNWLNSGSGELGVYSALTKGTEIKFKLVDEDGNDVNPVYALVHTDIDYGQGVSVTSDGKIGDIVPENSVRKHTFEIDGRSYPDMYSDMGDNKNINDKNDVSSLNDASSIPNGSYVSIVKGSTFTWRHNGWRGAYNVDGSPKDGTAFDEETLATARVNPQFTSHMYADLLGRGGKVTLHTPEIPTEPAVDKEFDVKDIDVSLQLPTTTYVDESGKELSPPEKGEKDKKAIPGYTFVRTNKKDNGDIEHVYKKNPNHTTYVDESGKTLLPSKEGIFDKEEIPSYEYVRTETHKNGDVEHIYKQIKHVTTYVDVNGNVLLPPKEGIQEKETIAGYEFVRTDNKPNGDVEHVYKQVSKITTYVDENGKELLPKKEGIHEKEKINGYEFVKTVTKENGDVEHVYKKLVEKKLPKTSVGITSILTGVAGMFGIGAYISRKKSK